MASAAQGVLGVYTPPLGAGGDHTARRDIRVAALFPSRSSISTGTWQFREIVTFRNERAGRFGLSLVVHTTPEALADSIPLLTGGSAVHTGQHLLVC